MHAAGTCVRICTIPPSIPRWVNGDKEKFVFDSLLLGNQESNRVATWHNSRGNRAPCFFAVSALLAWYFSRQVPSEPQKTKKRRFDGQTLSLLSIKGNSQTYILIRCAQGFKLPNGTGIRSLPPKLLWYKPPTPRRLWLYSNDIYSVSQPLTRRFLNRLS